MIEIAILKVMPPQIGEQDIGIEEKSLHGLSCFSRSSKLSSPGHWPTSSPRLF